MNLKIHRGQRQRGHREEERDLGISVSEERMGRNKIFCHIYE